MQLQGPAQGLAELGAWSNREPGVTDASLLSYPFPIDFYPGTDTQEFKTLRGSNLQIPGPKHSSSGQLAVQVLGRAQSWRPGSTSTGQQQKGLGANCKPTGMA